MEQFIVSARKYRPGTFESVVGQEHVTNTLKNAIRNNHLAQAFLFCGPRGVGKTTCARILAKTINCENLGPDTEPCNACNSCVSFNNSHSFNIYELDAASNNSVDDIRGLVEQVRYAPQGAKYKIYIIDEVHMLSTAAFNAFLKTLEEPPPYAIFILATTERHKILPTILSRCQIFDFNRISIPSIVGHLKNICSKESIAAETDALHVVAEKADGALRDALSIFDQMVSFSGNNLTYADVIRNLNILDYDYYFRVADLIEKQDTSGVLTLFDEVLTKGFDAHLFLGGLCDHFRNLLVCKDPATIRLLEVAETAAVRYARQAQALSRSLVLNSLNLASQYDLSFKSARNQRLHVELALIKMCHINSLFQAGDVISADKKKTPELAIAAEVPAENVLPEKTPLPVEKPVVTATPEVPPPAAKKVVSTKYALPSVSLVFEPGTTAHSQETVTAHKETVLAPQVSKAAYSISALQEGWMGFAQLKEEQKRMGISSGMRKAKLELENDVLKAEVPRSVVSFFDDEKSELLSFIRQKVETPGGFRLEIFGAKAEENNEEMLYTMRDKFNSMLKSNPNLLDFKNKLGLELDE